MKVDLVCATPEGDSLPLLLPAQLSSGMVVHSPQAWFCWGGAEQRSAS